jgi:DNA polymerase III subunit delta
MQIHPMMVLAGTEAFVRRELLERIRSAVLEENKSDMGYVRLDPSVTAAAVLDECRTMGMFAAKKLVVVEPADNLFKARADEDDGDESEPDQSGADAQRRGAATPRELIQRYAEAPAENTVLVLVCDNWLKTTRLHKLLDAQGAVHWCLPLRDDLLGHWLGARAEKEYKKKLEPAAAMRLAELVGADLARLDGELAKLALFAMDQNLINKNMVEQMVGFQHEQQVWDLIDALSAGNVRDALARHHELWQMDAKIGYTLVGAIFYWLGQVMRARELIDRRLGDGQIIKDLRLWPQPRALRTLHLARQWGVAGCRRAAEALLAADLAAKTSLGEPKRNIERFIVQICSA